ncbi:MAG: universal stress protein [Cyanobacteria bacterium SID2]|nr:universal stress protein [Cyanobacteria bacterium SID2]MBP0002609.1 universal stress protein [Cyanobacteria bacterium SBC]
MIEKILVAVAGRGLCEEMLNQLMEIPEIQRASITVLHVVPPQITADAVSEKLEEGGKILADAVKSMKVDPTKVKPLLKQGDPKTIVCDTAIEEDVDLIVMGSRGLGRLVSILENSVSQYVFQLADRPMLLVKDEVYVKRLKRVMVALDPSEGSKPSLDLALSWVKDLKDAKLILTHVNPPDIDVRPEEDPVLAEALQKAKTFGIDARCLTSKGKAGPEICRITEEENIDLLILGSPDRRPTIAKGLPDLDRLLGQSLSDYVRVYANCPVLLTRSNDE